MINIQDFERVVQHCIGC